MNLSMKWLNDYVKADMQIKEFADAMTMSGSKVEKWTDLSEPLKNIVVGKVISIVRHIDSEKLWIAQVDVGKENPVQIVTGALNVYAGAYVPVVLDGGVVIDRHSGNVTEIKKGRLRGTVSEGMMCSFDELGMDNEDFPYSSADGILILNGDPDFEKIKTGMDVTEFVGLKDTAVEFEITNNRPDCLSVLGLAREASAVFCLPFEPRTPEIKGVDGDISKELTVEVKTENCSRYMAAVVKNVKIKPSPRWMRERLRASGVRSINNFVDITNYVMLEYGHPMHAFDKKYVTGNKIIVRQAENGEKITLLDGTEQLLGTETMIIADAEKPIAVAGVMGGEYSGIMDDTETVVFESACFDGVSVRLAAKKIGRRTESSARFEKKLNPINARDALYRALELVEMLGCGEVIRSVIDEGDYRQKWKPTAVKHNPDKINAILGTEISAGEQLEILKRLGFEVSGNTVTPPHVRIDIDADCDLAEEVARIYGYDRIEPTVPLLGTQGVMTEEEVFENKIISVMLGQGMYECLSYGFISPKVYAKAGITDTGSIKIRNPLGEDTGVMRMSALPSMLEILSRNSNSRNSAVRFFEIMRIFLPDGNNTENLPDEKKVLAMGMYGADEEFFTIKGIIEELLEKTGANTEDIRFSAVNDNKSYHAGRCASVSVKDRVIGIFGEINPAVAERYNLTASRAYAAEIMLGDLYEAVSGSITPRYKALPKYPAMTRDLSLVCDEAVSSGHIMDIIRQNADTNENILESVSFFDIYRGNQIPEGKKSISYKLVFRKSTGTLTDAEADSAIDKVLGILADNGIVIRG